MFSENAVIATLAILSMVLFTSTTTNALAIPNDETANITDVDLLNTHSHYKIKDNAVILDTLFGQIRIPIPDGVKAQQNSKLMTRQGFFDNVHSNAADFFECNEQAQIALSTHSENYRNWEAFFKRNSVNDTFAVRYCCNLLEYVDNAHMSMSPECRDQIRLQDHVMTNSEVRYTCRQYEFNSVQCFLVRWMYWWIPLIALLLIALGILCSCCAIKNRRNKGYVPPSREKKSLVTGI